MIVSQWIIPENSLRLAPVSLIWSHLGGFDALTLPIDVSGFQGPNCLTLFVNSPAVSPATPDNLGWLDGKASHKNNAKQWQLMVHDEYIIDSDGWLMFQKPYITGFQSADHMDHHSCSVYELPFW